MSSELTRQGVGEGDQAGGDALGRCPLAGVAFDHGDVGPPRLGHLAPCLQSTSGQRGAGRRATGRQPMRKAGVLGCAQYAAGVRLRTWAHSDGVKSTT